MRAGTVCQGGEMRMSRKSDDTHECHQLVFCGQFLPESQRDLGLDDLVKALPQPEDPRFEPGLADALATGWNKRPTRSLERRFDTALCPIFSHTAFPAARDENRERRRHERGVKHTPKSGLTLHLLDTAMKFR